MHHYVVNPHPLNHLVRHKTQNLSPAWMLSKITPFKDGLSLKILKTQMGKNTSFPMCANERIYQWSHGQSCLKNLAPHGANTSKHEKRERDKQATKKESVHMILQFIFWWFLLSSGGKNGQVDVQ